ncbi:hypothetical protein MKX01_041526 [Papaver californicum]|nr:hypothetical protein MKX01_041526 [Papaver californicum]
MEVVAEAAEGEGCMPVRIFVGGLGLSVTAQDMEKTFSSLGSINGVEIVRTSGRSFAYMDFQPNSSKALNKLFSMYNDCVWKGGRLKLEKAKEHYFVRLKREWDEEAQIANEALKVKEEEPVVEKKIEQSEKLKSLTQEAMQLNIYIPRFRKVKPIPFRGSGKHKYSFQRIEVPPLPIHFCDCEEHCRPVETTKKELVNALEMETDSAVADEEELDMMRSVLDKILKRENSSGVASRGTEITKEVDGSAQPNDDLHHGDNEVDGVEGGADDLVINMVSGENGRLRLMESQGRGTISTDKESNSRKRQLSVDAATSKKPIVQKRKNTEPFDSPDHTANKKARLVLGEESNQDVFTTTISKKKGISTTVAIEAKGVAKAAKHSTPEQKSNTQPLAKGFSWTQKSPWKKMVGETSDMAFSISHILPETTTNNLSPISKHLDAENLTSSRKKNEVKKPKTKSTEKVSKDLELGIDTPQENLTTERPAPSQIMSENAEERGEAKPTNPETDIQQSLRKSSVDRADDLPLKKKGITQDEFTTASATTEVPLKILSEDSEPPEDPKPTKRKTVINQSRGPSWTQKSSWKNLVGETSNSTFSLAHISPDIAFTQEKTQEANNLGTASSSDSKAASDFFGQGWKFNEISKSGNQKDKVNVASNSQVSKSECEVGGLAGSKGVFNVFRKNVENENEVGEPIKKVAENEVAAKVSPFMRSEASQKEWLKLKKSLSGSKKRKKGEEN